MVNVGKSFTVNTTTNSAIFLSPFENSSSHEYQKITPLFNRPNNNEFNFDHSINKTASNTDNSSNEYAQKDECKSITASSSTSDFDMSLSRSTEYQQIQCDSFTWDVKEFETLCSREQLPQYDDVPYLDISNRTLLSQQQYASHALNHNMNGSESNEYCLSSAPVQSKHNHFSLNEEESKLSNVNNIHLSQNNQNSNSSISTSNTFKQSSLENVQLNQNTISSSYEYRKLKAPDITYKQHIGIRYLQPANALEPSPIIIKEIREPTPPPPPPLIIRQRVSSPRTPSPIILREKPPTPIPQEPPRVLIKKLPPQSPPPRQIILIRYPTPPPKPRNIIVERWLPQDKPKIRKVIYERIKEKHRAPIKNYIVSYSPRKLIVDKIALTLPTRIEDPERYSQQYSRSLVDSSKLDNLIMSTDQNRANLHRPQLLSNCYNGSNVDYSYNYKHHFNQAFNNNKDYIDNMNSFPEYYPCPYDTYPADNTGCLFEKCITCQNCFNNSHPHLHNCTVSKSQNEINNYIPIVQNNANQSYDSSWVNAAYS